MPSWSDTWGDILGGGPARWKVDDIDAKRIALGHIAEHASGPDEVRGPLRILCPLAGDDPFVRHAWSEGHVLTAVDIVPEALRSMRDRFGGDADDWTSEGVEGAGDGSIWKHASGRATLYEGDVLARRRELLNSFDAVYDKDSFGALPLNVRSKFCERLSGFVKDGGVVYLEVKNKETGREGGPPFHVEKSDVMDEANFGASFEYVAGLGEVYPLKMPGMKQIGHVLRRLPRG